MANDLPDGFRVDRLEEPSGFIAYVVGADGRRWGELHQTREQAVAWAWAEHARNMIDHAADTALKAVRPQDGGA